MASLLEEQGFTLSHGRENIYLNGTILGMTRKEVNEIDDIVELKELRSLLIRR